MAFNFLVTFNTDEFEDNGDKSCAFVQCYIAYSVARGKGYQERMKKEKERMVGGHGGLMLQLKKMKYTSGKGKR